MCTATWIKFNRCFMRTIALLLVGVFGLSALSTSAEAGWPWRTRGRRVYYTRPAATRPVATQPAARSFNQYGTPGTRAGVRRYNNPGYNYTGRSNGWRFRRPSPGVDFTPPGWYYMPML